MGRRQYVRPALGLAVVLAQVSAACTGGSHPGPGPAPSDRVALMGGTLHVGMVGFGSSFDPRVESFDLAVRPSFNELQRCCLVRTLLSYNGQDTRHGGALLHPDLAARFPQISADGMTWTFQLKRGIHYAPPLQRREVVARDFVRALERELSPSPPNLSYNTLIGLGVVDWFKSAIQGAKEYADGTASAISGLETPDDHTLSFHLTEASGDFAYRLALPQTAPIPPIADDPTAQLGVATGHDGDFGYFLVATGPYMYEGADKMDPSLPLALQAPPSGIRPDSVTLVRNPSWDPSTDDLRKAYVDRIVLTPIDTRVASQLTPDVERSVEAGNLDLVLGGFPDPPTIRRFATTAGLKNRLFQTERNSALYLYINVAVPPFDDVHVRRALSLAFDKQAAVRAFEEQRAETGTAATHIVPDAFENSLLLNFDPYGPAHSGNLEAAEREMAQSKYDADHDGVCDAIVCSPIIMPVRMARPERVAIARIARTSLGPLGIDLRPHPEDDEQFFASYPSPRVPLILVENLPDDPGPGLWLEEFVGSGGLSPGCCNLALVGASPRYLKKHGYAVTTVPTVQDRIDQCHPLVFERAIECWARLDQYLMNQVVPAVPLVSVANPAIVSARVTKFTFDQATEEIPQPALDQIALAAGARAERVPAPSIAPTSKGHPNIPDGTYEVTLTSRDARRFEITDPDDVYQNTGTLTVTLAGGRWRAVHTSDNFVFVPVTSGVYQGAGNLVRFVSELPPADAVSSPTERWRFDGHALHFRLASCRDLDRLDPNAPHLCENLRLMFEAHPWIKVG